MLKNLIILFSVSSAALAQISLKKGMLVCDCDFGSALSKPGSLILSLVLNPYVAGGVCLHVIALFTWLYVLKHIDVSYAYPFMSIGIVIVLLLGSVLFNEVIDAYRILGVATIIFGIVLVGNSAV